MGPSPLEQFEEYVATFKELAGRMKSGTAQWGNWYYVPTEGAGYLQHREPGTHHTYEVGLEDCNSGAAILRWIYHLEQKPWLTAADLGHFVRALAQFLPLDDWVHEPIKAHDVTVAVKRFLSEV